MQDETIITTSKVGRRLDSIIKKERISCLMFGNSEIPMVKRITIGRAGDNDVVIDNILASRYHAIIQKIKDAYFLKDLDSTNGTLLNGTPIPKDKYVKLGGNDTITIGKTNMVIG